MLNTVTIIILVNIILIFYNIIKTEKERKKNEHFFLVKDNPYLMPFINLWLSHFISFSFIKLLVSRIFDNYSSNIILYDRYKVNDMIIDIYS